MDDPRIIVDLPDWLSPFVRAHDRPLHTIEQRMELAIELSRLNVQHKTGGPFGAAVFEESSGRLVGVGVNLVAFGRCSVLHAEMVAIMVTQRAKGTHDLDSPRSGPCQLVTSCEPCAMCLGAIPWSGVKGVVCGARGQDAEGIGFDEGAKPHDWVRALEARGIAVVRDVLRTKAQAVLLQYQKDGGVIY